MRLLTLALGLILLPFLHAQAGDSLTERFYTDPVQIQSVDGRLFRDGYTDWFQTIDAIQSRVADTDDEIQDISNVFGNGNGPNFYSNNRLHLGFDTTLLPDDAEIIKAKVGFYGTAPDLSAGSERRVYVVSGNPEVTSALVTSDYGKAGNASFGVTDGNWSLTLPTEVTLNQSGIDWINELGATNFVLKGWYDFNRVAPTDLNELYIHINLSETPGLGRDPYLEVTYTIPDDEMSLSDMIKALIEAVEGSDVKDSTKQSYLAHLEKLPEMIETANNRAIVNQMKGFVRKVEADKEQGMIDVTLADSLISQAEDIMALLEVDDVTHEVDRMTQIESPFPSIAATAGWASLVYAGGRASSTDDCGLTIGECGCALTTLSMLGRYRGITTGIDGTNVDPGSMNDWLLSHDGYTADGSILWLYALAFLGEEKNGKVMSTLTLDGEGTAVTDAESIQTFVMEENPAVAFSKDKGHWFLLNGVTETGYYVRDPFWYETETTNDVKDVESHVQGYDDVVTKANLFTHSKTPQALPEAIETVLESPAELLLTDSKGRRLGYDAGVVVDEIEGGSYDQEDFIRDPGDVSDAEPHYAKRLMLVKPQGNTFELSVIGTGEGTYSLTTAVSDGKGKLTNTAYEDETSSGAVHTYTIVTDLESIELPSYLRDILALIPQSEQKKFVQAFEVVFKQTEKDHVAVTGTLIQNLIGYIELKHGNEAWAGAAIVALQAL
jgi:hypothetical protein